MRNFGLSRLVLVAPEASPMDDRAIVVARRARDLLGAAQVVADLDTAVAGATVVVGTTARRGHRRAAVGPRALVERLADLGSGDRVALVFGPEDSGLSTAHVRRCDLLCTIPTRGPLASLNLAQAVAVVLWEISQADWRPQRARRRVASRAEVEGLLDHAALALEAIGYFAQKGREQTLSEMRRILGAAGLGPEQVKALRGVCRQTLWALGRGRARGG
jgi:tRNA/rRNA methyltransferase